MSSTIAAIDVGSNAIRLAIARVATDGTFQVVHLAREPVRLGHDVFGTNRISPETIKAALIAFRRFRELLNKHSVSRFRAVATSAVREAENGDRLAAQISRRYGIGLTVIDPEEEARLVHLAVKDRIRLGERSHCLWTSAAAVSRSVLQPRMESSPRTALRWAAFACCACSTNEG